MRLILPSIYLVCGLACAMSNPPPDDADSDTDSDTTPTPDDCPAGLVAAGDATLSANNFIWSGEGFGVGYSEDADRVGGEPACLSTTGIEGSWRFVVGDEYAGRLHVRASDIGLLPFDDVGLILEVFIDGEALGDTSYVGPGGWSAGQVDVTRSSGTTTFIGTNVSGTDIDGNTLFLNFTATATL